MEQIGKINRKEVATKAIPYTKEEIEVLLTSNFDVEVNNSTYKSIVEETLTKIGENEFCYFDEEGEEGQIFSGEITDVTENMDAYY